MIRRPSHLNTTLNVDVVVVGGGIAGLWLLARLHQLGYGALLIESRQLGVGQTLCAQGIIHGGVKYALHGQVNDSATALGEMPALWRRCLSGDGDIDLREATVLADHQYLWATRAPTSRLAAFFAGALMRSRMEKVTDTAGELPDVLRHPQFQGAAYRLDEPVLDIASVLSVFAARYRDVIVRSRGPVMLKSDGTLNLHHPIGPPLVVRPGCAVFTAGAGNATLPWATLQLRPLHMVMARGTALPGALYAHCLGAGEIPRLTVTSHHDAGGRLIWYLGGGLAEDGVKRSRDEQIRAARRELETLLPWADWSKVEFATFMTQRAEAHQRRGVRPAEPGVFRDGRVIAAWPTKLALAPLLAERIITVLKTLAVQPRLPDLRLLLDWPRPEIAAPPWDWETMEWS